MYDAVLLRPSKNGFPSDGKGGICLCSLFLEKPPREGFPVEDGYSPRKATNSIKQEARLRVLSSASDDDAWTQMMEQLTGVGLHGSLRVA